jgi:hypothetical protein
MKTLGLLTLATVFGAAATQGHACAKKFTPGEPYPWESSELMPGDEYARVYLTVDHSGHASTCRIGETNIYSKDRRWYLCNSYKTDWYTHPLVKDGKSVEAQVRHYVVITGTRHLDHDWAAGKRWFQLHPEESRKCYPDYRRRAIDWPDPGDLQVSAKR